MLWLGIVCVAVLLTVTVLGPSLAPYDLTHQQDIEYDVVDGKEVMIVPPIPPGEKYPLGTDKWGYDLLTKLLYGARYTLFVALAVAFMRVVLGTLLGLTAGMKEKVSEGWTTFEQAWGYVPVFLPCYFILFPISFGMPYEESTMIAVFVAVAGLLGIPSVLGAIRGKTQKIKNEPFILSAIALGAGKARVIFRHIFPQLKEHVIVLFVHEMVAVLTLMGQLGIFSIFVGGTLMELDPPLFHSKTNEWAGLIGQYRSFLYSDSKWIFYIPLAAYLFAVASFALLARGLQDLYRDRYQRTPYV